MNELDMLDNDMDFLGLNASIYEELKDERQDNEALQKCINDTIDALLLQKPEEGKMRKPICLLGKIQSGKTRAFIGIMAKAFDEGINTIIVLTKNSKILGQQTTSRIANELNSLKAGSSIAVNYITDIDDGVILGNAQLEQRQVIVGIKHYQNVDKIIDYVIKHNPKMAHQKILIIDDEGDVSTVGYRKESENVPYESLSQEEQLEVIRELGDDDDSPTNVKRVRSMMLQVAEKINTLREGIKEHYFLQVTATPSSIFLQPEVITIEDYNSDYSIENTPKAPLRAEKTILLPIHDKYIGGEYFFGEATDEESMAQFTYRQVMSTELGFMSKRDQRHINNIFKSDNFPKLTEFVDNILLATAAQTACVLNMRQQYLNSFKTNPHKVLNALKDKTGGYSAMVHTSTQKKIHEYQAELIQSYIDTCKSIIKNNPDSLKEHYKEKLKNYFEHSILPAYEIYLKNPSKDSYLKDLDTIDFDLIFDCVKAILLTDHVRIFTINSDAQIASRIDSVSGELKREVFANIYVGGQSLDRGITIQNLLGFFYGREPLTAQLDTTLQHARLYGARKPDDLVFTRMYCSDVVHRRLTEITDIDHVLRESIKNNDGDNRFAAIELGIKGQIKPTNPNRILLSDCINLKSHKRILPIGFNTRSGNACEQPMQIIDDIIKHAQNRRISGHKDAFFIEWSDFEQIFNAFMRGMISSNKWSINPKDQNWELTELNAFYRIVKSSYFKDDPRLILVVKRGRKLNRLRIDGRPQDSPDTAQSDRVQMKEIMRTHNVPGVFLFEQAGQIDQRGDINYGWQGNRFYWPLFMLPQFKRNIMVSLDALKKEKELVSSQ